MNKDKVLNGVDVEKLNTAMDAMKQNPAQAKVSHKVQNKWIDGAHR